MRIIAGDARGRKLYAPAGEDTRPTADRIRESLFNILGTRVYNARVLDLFGGTGAMALESMSRGAQYAVIVDNAQDAIRTIERNALNVLGERKDSCVRIVRADYRSAIRTLGEQPFNLVFLDPPYRMTESYADALRLLTARGALADDCIVLAEHARINAIVLPDQFEIFDTRHYGKTSVEFAREVKQG